MTACDNCGGIKPSEALAKWPEMRAFVETLLETQHRDTIAAVIDRLRSMPQREKGADGGWYAVTPQDCADALGKLVDVVPAPAGACTENAKIEALCKLLDAIDAAYRNNGYYACVPRDVLYYARLAREAVEAVKKTQ